MSRKLLYLVNQRMPTEKAYGIQIAKMCGAFAGNELDVRLLIPTRKNSTDKDIFEYYGLKNNFKVTKVSSPDFYLPGRLDQVAFVIKSFLSATVLSIYALLKGTDIVFSRDELPIYFLSFCRGNLVFEAHRFSNRRLGFYKRFKKTGVKIITISSGLRDEFIKFGFKPEKILVAHDGVDINQFNTFESQEECRRKLGLPLDKKIIGYVGQLETMGMEKGVQLLLKAIQQLARDNPMIMGLIVGGQARDIEHYKLNVSHEVIMFAGQQPHHQIPYYLKACDILVMPFPSNPHYSFYMSPLKLFEYMASGQPIVATDLPAVREILNSENSVLVKPDDSQELTKGFELVLKNKELADKIGSKAQLDAKDHTWLQRANKISRFIIRT